MTSSSLPIIEIAGVDGSGKSTVIQHLMRHFNELGQPAYERSLRSVYKRVLDDIAFEKTASQNWSSMFDANSVELAQALEMLQLVQTQLAPFAQSRQLFLTDTYAIRWLGVATDWGADLGVLGEVYSRLPKPIVSIYLSVDPSTAHDRILARTKGDHILKMGNPSAVAKYAAALDSALHFVPYEIQTVDANTTEQETVLAAIEIVERALKQRKEVQR